LAIIVAAASAVAAYLARTVTASAMPSDCDLPSHPEVAIPPTPSPAWIATRASIADGEIADHAGGERRAGRQM
jgi:hypothetical protein